MSPALPQVLGREVNITKTEKIKNGTISSAEYRALSDTVSSLHFELDDFFFHCIIPNMTAPNKIEKINMVATPIPLNLKASNPLTFSKGPVTPYKSETTRNNRPEFIEAPALLAESQLAHIDPEEEVEELIFYFYNKILFFLF